MLPWCRERQPTAIRIRMIGEGLLSFSTSRIGHLESPCFADVQLFVRLASNAVDDIGWGTGEMISDLDGLLGPWYFLMLQMKGGVLHCVCRIQKFRVDHLFGMHFWLKSYLLSIFLWHFNEINGHCEKILPVSGSLWSNLKFFRMMYFTAWLWGWMEFYRNFPSVTFVVLTANQVKVGRSDGTLEQQKQVIGLQRYIFLCML